MVHQFQYWHLKSLLKKDNVKCVGRTLDGNNTALHFEEGIHENIKNIVWATGFKPNFEWIEGIILNDNKYPKNYRGVSDIKGLYFLGLPWLYTRGSATLGGVKKDAKFLSNYIEKLEVKPAYGNLLLKNNLFNVKRM